MTKELLSASDLNNLRDAVRGADADFRASAASALECALEAGDALNRAKKSLGHGAFMGWVQDECEVGQRAANVYMSLAKRKADGQLTEAVELGGSIRRALAVDPKPPKTSSGDGKAAPSDAPKTAARKPSEPAEPAKTTKAAPGDVKPSSSVKTVAKPHMRTDVDGAIESLPMFAELVIKVREAKTLLKELANSPGGRDLNLQSIEASLQTAIGSIRYAKPYCLCVYCKDGCSACDPDSKKKQRGWMSLGSFKAAPEDKKEKAELL